ncbi:hypothetical protein IE53DRAFT_145581 [Violaceomyces palustris]|uniref:Uncharacterized protein n=1 Tax=Violaceomyces palustris TaxID=1673888 RepID=A0ACD0P6B4_9BASI|nr:hypothetical protein IE53DRAFT_145581 [Violaceomyces palustris]
MLASKLRGGGHSRAFSHLMVANIWLYSLEDLGESFKAYLCVCNESVAGVRDPSLRVEMQTGEPNESAPGRPQHTGSKVLLAHVTLRDSLNPLSRENDDGSSPLDIMERLSKIETTIKYEIKELGNHCLICTVSYKVLVVESGQQSWVERNFRKFYKFSVPTSPILVRTKAHTAKAPATLLHYDHRVREKVMLEVQVQNTSPSPIVFEGLNLEAEKGWTWKSIDRPSLDEDTETRENERNLGLWRGAEEPLLPDDVRQYLFALVPLSDRPTRPMPPVPLAQLISFDSGSRDVPRSRGQPPNPLLNSSRPSMLSASSQPGGQQQNSSPSKINEFLSESMTVVAPLGKLEIQWRMSQGEQGRLQTSQIARRKHVHLPVTCLPDHAQQESPPAVTGGPFMKSILDESRISERAVVSTPPPISKDGPSDASKISLGTPLTLTSEAPQSFPNPLLECDLSFTPLLLSSSQLFEVDKPFEVHFDLWVRDLSSLYHSQSSGDASETKKEEEEEDSDDDRPLSDIISPRNTPRSLPPVGSRRSSATSTVTASHPRAWRKGTRYLRLAVQHISLPPPGHTLAQSNFSNGATTTDPTSAGQGRPMPNQSIPLRTPSSQFQQNQNLANAVRGSMESIRSDLGGGLSSSMGGMKTPTMSNQATFNPASITSSPNSPAPYRRASGGGPAGPSHLSLTTNAERGGPSSPHTSRSTTPVPPPPPKSPSLLGHVDLASLQQDQAEPTKGARWNLPPPFFDLSRPNLLSKGINPRPGWPDQSVLKLGGSVQFLDPIPIPFNPSPGGGGEGDEAELASSTIRFKSEYVSLEEGLVRIGGIRILVLGWVDRFAEGNASDGNENNKGQEQEEREINLRNPIVLREWDVVAEVWVQGKAC